MRGVLEPIDERPFVPLPTIYRYKIRRFRHDATRVYYERWWGQEGIEYEDVHPRVPHGDFYLPNPTRAEQDEQNQLRGTLRSRRK